MTESELQDEIARLKAEIAEWKDYTQHQTNTLIELRGVNANLRSRLDACERRVRELESR
jgi:chromosome segregation ATPase